MRIGWVSRKRSVGIVAGVLVVASAGLCAAARAADVDVLGIKLGVSTVDETVKMLLAFDPPLDVVRHKGVFYVGNAQVPKSEHVGFLTANGERAGIYSFNQIVSVIFSAPPEESKALYVNRQATYPADKATSLENMMASLKGKYGEPGYVVQTHPREIFLAWAWAPNGQLMKLTERHPCAQRGATTISIDDFVQTNAGSKAANFVKAGCSAVLQVTVNFQNNIVGALTVNAFDAADIAKSVAETSAYVENFRAENDRATHEQAAGNKAPRL